MSNREDGTPLEGVGERLQKISEQMEADDAYLISACDPDYLRQAADLIASLQSEKDELRAEVERLTRQADREWVSGARYGWNCAEGGNRPRLDSAIEGRRREIRQALNPDGTGGGR